jgi:hypothetical protein
VEGEPEAASWWRNGRKPFVIYTFNPVATLRVLDVATVPPIMRAAIASQLPLLDAGKILGLFDSPDPHDRLRALWAARELEYIDFIPQADRLTGDPEPVVADQARETRDRLRKVNDARFEGLANLRVLTEAAPNLIRNLSDPAFAQTLRPTEDELVELFDENLKSILVGAVDALYGARLRMSKVEAGDKIEAFASTAGMLRSPNMLSGKFPLGYRDVAGWMNPRRIWLTWTITAPGGASERYDGLAWLGSRWLWLPKVYRFVAPFLLQDAG